MVKGFPPEGISSNPIVQNKHTKSMNLSFFIWKIFPLLKC